MGSSQSKGPATEGTFDTVGGQVEQEALKLAQLDTHSVLTSQILAVPDKEAISLAVGVLMERLFCPNEAREFTKCFLKHKLSPDQAVQPGRPCVPAHEQFIRCLNEKNVAVKAGKVVETFSAVKCPEQSKQMLQCLQKRRSAQEGGGADLPNCSAQG
eukprot:RCo010683